MENKSKVHYNKGSNFGIEIEEKYCEMAVSRLKGEN